MLNKIKLYAKILTIIIILSSWGASLFFAYKAGRTKQENICLNEKQEEINTAERLRKEQHLRSLKREEQLKKENEEQKNKHKEDIDNLKKNLNNKKYHSSCVVDQEILESLNEGL